MTKQQQAKDDPQRFTVQSGPWFRVDVLAISPRGAALNALEMGSDYPRILATAALESDPEYPIDECSTAEYEPEKTVEVIDEEGRLKLIADTAELYDQLNAMNAPSKRPTYDSQSNQAIPLTRHGNSIVSTQDEVKVDAIHVYDVLERFPDWEEMDAEGGMRLLSAIEEAHSLEEGREGCKIELDPFISVEGEYDRVRNTITLKSELLDLADYQPVLRSLFQQQRACSQSLAAERNVGKQASASLLRKDQLVFAAKRIRALANLQVARAKAEEQRREKCRGGQPPPLVRKRIHQLQKQQEIE